MEVVRQMKTAQVETFGVHAFDEVVRDIAPTSSRLPGGLETWSSARYPRKASGL